MSKPLQEILQRVGKTVKRVKCAAFGRYLIVTNIATCGCVLAVGDIASQRLEHSLSNLSSKFAIDWNRNGTLITLFHVLKICHYLITKLYHFFSWAVFYWTSLWSGESLLVFVIGQNSTSNHEENSL